MNRHHKHQLLNTATGLLLVVVLSFAFHGCSDSPVAPEEPIPVDQIVEEIAALPFPAPEAEDAALTGSITSNSFEAVVDVKYNIDAAEGGEVSLLTISPQCTFEVPEGSIADAATRTNVNLDVRVVREDATGFQIHQFDFGPDGLQFSNTKPAILHLPVSAFQGPEGQDPIALIWVYYNEETERWEFEDLVRASKDGFFHVPVYHFSSYRFGIWGDWLSQGGQ